MSTHDHVLRPRPRRFEMLFELAHVARVPDCGEEQTRKDAIGQNVNIQLD